MSDTWTYIRSGYRRIDVEPAKEGVEITIWHDTQCHDYEDIVIPTDEAIALANYILNNAVPKTKVEDGVD